VDELVVVVVVAAAAVEDLVEVAVVDHGVAVEVVVTGMQEVATTVVDGEVSIVMVSIMKCRLCQM
jgi:hypothetical protein